MVDFSVCWKTEIQGLMARICLPEETLSVVLKKWSNVCSDVRSLQSLKPREQVPVSPKGNTIACSHLHLWFLLPRGPGATISRHTYISIHLLLHREYMFLKSQWHYRKENVWQCKQTVLKLKMHTRMQIKTKAHYFFHTIVLLEKTLKLKL